jgi:PadR family transcriptional regulator PadR
VSSADRIPNNRRARFYTLTRKGRKELVREESERRRIASAIMRILGPGRTQE